MTKKDVNMFQTMDHDYFLVNYDCQTQFRRHVGFKLVNIVFLTNPLRFEQFSSKIYNLQYNDAVIFILKNYTVKGDEKIEPWRLRGMEKAGVILIKNLLNDDMFSIYFYGDVNRPVVERLQKTSANLENYREFFNRFITFRGYVFTIAYGICPPFTIEKCLESHHCFLEGIETKILKTLSEKHNFSYHLINFSARDEAWNQMIMAVHNGSVDWAIGCISQTPERLVLIEYTDYLMFQHYEGVFYRMDDPSNNWKIVLEPLAEDSWIAIIFISTFVGFILRKIHSCLTVSKIEKGLAIKKIQQEHYVTAVFGVLFEQAIVGVKSKFLSTSIILGTWRIMAIIISNSYKSKLSSTMIMPTSHDPNTVTELLQRKYNLEINLEDNILFAYLIEFLKQPKNILRNFDSISVCSGLLNLVRNNSLAIIEDKAPLHYSILSGCVKELGFENIAKLRTIRENVCPSRHAWPLQRAAPYRLSFSKTLSKLRESGILFHWYDEYYFKLSRSNNYVPNDTKVSLKLNEVMGHFYVLFLGLLISFFVFVYELFHHQYVHVKLPSSLRK